MLGSHTLFTSIRMSCTALMQHLSIPATVSVRSSNGLAFRHHKCPQHIHRLPTKAFCRFSVSSVRKSAADEQHFAVDSERNTANTRSHVDGSRGPVGEGIGQQGDGPQNLFLGMREDEILHVPPSVLIGQAIYHDYPPFNPRQFRDESLSRQLESITSPNGILRIIYDKLDTSRDAEIFLKHVSILRKALQRCRVYYNAESRPKSLPLDLLFVFGPILSRLKLLNVKPTSELLELALEYACYATSHLGIMESLRLLHTHGYKFKSFYIMKVFAYSLNHPALPMTKFYSKKLLMVFSGWENNGVPSPGETRSICLEEGFSGRSDMRSFLLLVRILSMLRAGDAMFSRWTTYSKAWSSLAMFERGTMPVLTSLVRMHDYKNAWALIDSSHSTRGINLFEKICSMPKVGAVYESRLIDDGAEYITVWDDFTKRVVGKRLHDLLTGAESQLGVKWVSGEDGYHTSIGEKYADTIERHV